MMLAAGVHIGSKNADAGMARYIYKRRADGTTSWLLLAAVCRALPVWPCWPLFDVVTELPYGGWGAELVAVPAGGRRGRDSTLGRGRGGCSRLSLADARRATPFQLLAPTWLAPLALPC